MRSMPDFSARHPDVVAFLIGAAVIVLAHVAYLLLAMRMGLR